MLSALKANSLSTSAYDKTSADSSDVSASHICMRFDGINIRNIWIKEFWKAAKRYIVFHE